MKRYNFFMQWRVVNAPSGAYEALQSFGGELTLRLKLEQRGDIEFQVSTVGEEVTHSLSGSAADGLVALGKVTKSSSNELLGLTYAIRLYPGGNAGLGVAAAVEQ